MRILFLTHYSKLYGANRSLIDLVIGLKNKGIIPFVICFEDGDVVHVLRENKIEVIVFSYFTWMYGARREILHFPYRFISNLIKFPKFLMLVKSLRIDLIHSNSSVIQLGAYSSYFLKIPHIWHIREFGWEDYRLKCFYPEFIVNFLYKRATYLIAISNAIKEKKLSLIKENVKVIYNGVVSEKSIINTPKSIAKNKITFSIIGKLLPSKGQLIALKSFKSFNHQYKNSELIIVGDGFGDYHKELLYYIENNKLSGVVKMTGFIKDVSQIYKTTDVLLMCSHFEGMGRVTVEALSYGIPVIGYAGGGTVELIKNNYNGYLYDDFEDEKKLAELMIKIVESDISFEKMSEKSLITARLYTKEKFISNFIGLLQAINF